jgi:hypothetical protein
MFDENLTKKLQYHRYRRHHLRAGDLPSCTLRSSLNSIHPQQHERWNTNSHTSRADRLQITTKLATRTYDRRTINHARRTVVASVRMRTYGITVAMVPYYIMYGPVPMSLPGSLCVQRLARRFASDRLSPASLSSFRAALTLSTSAVPLPS